MMAGMVSNEVVLSPFEQIWDCKKEPDLALMKLARLLS
jgi:hypothetical protein